MVVSFLHPVNASPNGLGRNQNTPRPRMALHRSPSGPQVFCQWYQPVQLQQWPPVGLTTEPDLRMTAPFTNVTNIPSLFHHDLYLASPIPPPSLFPSPQLCRRLCNLLDPPKSLFHCIFVSFFSLFYHRSNANTRSATIASFNAIHARPLSRSLLVANTRCTRTSLLYIGAF